jgi:hypothetical protein
MDSIAVSAVKLGIDFQGYEEVARNIQRIDLISLVARQNILERGMEELPLSTRIKICNLVDDMGDDREFSKIAGLNYSNPPRGQKLFVTSITDYLLRNQSSSNQNS